VVIALAAVLSTWAQPAGATPTAATLYREALATTKSWTVHYVSSADDSHVPILETGDAGPASGTQEVLIGTGAKSDVSSLIVIGDLTYLKGNAIALQEMAGFTPAQAASAAGQWIVFSTGNSAFTQVVAGVRSHDVADEVAVQGPYSLGRSRKLDGYQVDAIYGTQKLPGIKKMHVVLYVRASGRHVLVEEDTVGANDKPNALERIVFSKWGESVRPKAPHASITLGSISTT
jgi:hypothetical protein